MQFNPSLAIEPNNTFDVVYQRDYVTPPTGSAHDVAISGLQSTGDVASSTVSTASRALILQAVAFRRCGHRARRIDG